MNKEKKLKNLSKVQDVQVEFANLAGMLASRLNLSPIVGQIYALLYLSPEPVSLNEMVEKLKISKASASINIRYLESWGAVKKVWVNSSRKDYYEANPDIFGIVMDRLREGLKKRLSEVEGKFSSLNISIEGFGRREKDKFLMGRIENLKELYRFVKKLLDDFSEFNFKSLTKE